MSTEKEIIEAGNITISEFVGKKFQAFKNNRSYDKMFDTYKECKDFCDSLEDKGYEPCVGWTIGLGKYHSSWDWLMPVVEKYAEVTYGTGWDNSFGYAEIFSELRKKYNTYHEGMAATIKDVWISLVQFIHWYNQNK